METEVDWKVEDLDSKSALLSLIYSFHGTEFSLCARPYAWHSNALC